MSFPNLSALAVKERSVTLFFLILSILAGIYSFSFLGRAEDPSFTVRMMVVSVIWPGADANDLQDQVVDRLEKRIQEVKYLDNIVTTVRPGRADLLVEFKDYSPAEIVPDLYYEVRKRMLDEKETLPDGVIGPLVNDDFSDVYFSLISLAAPGLPLRQLTREVEQIRDRVQRIEGVHKALLFGERPERVFVEFDNAKLVNLGISTQAVFEAIKNQNRLLPAGLLETDGPRIYLRLDADLSNPEELAKMPIRIGKKVINLSDIATIRRGYEEPPTYMVRAGGEDTLLLGIIMKEGENGLDLGERMAEFLDKERSRLPLGMELTQLTNQAEAISGAVNLFQIKFLVAVIVVVLVSIFAIGLRAGLVIGIAVPLTLGLTFLVMHSSGMTLNRVSLGALILALGLLVDDAIIAIEMMMVKMEEGWGRVRAASHAWNVTAAPMLFGTLVTVAGFVPIGFAKSSTGEYAGGIFWVLAIALLISWLVAVTFTPYLGVRMLKVMATSHHTTESLYQTTGFCRLRRIVRWCVDNRKTVVTSTVLLLIISIVGMVGVVQKQFFPSSDRPEVLISVFHPQGSAIKATDKTVQKLEKVLKEMGEVKTLSAYIGAGPPRFFISENPELPNPAFAKLIVVTHDEEARDTVMAEITRRVNEGEFPEARVRVVRLLYGPPVVWPVSFRVVGADPLQLRHIGHKLREIMAANPHTHDAHLEWDERVPVLHLVMEPDRLRLMGLTPSDVAQQLQFELNGVPVTQLRENIRSVELRARGNAASFVGYQDLEIRTRDGRKVPLSQLGRLEVQYEEPVIKRYNREPFLAVEADIRNAQANDVTAAIWKASETFRSELPEGYRIDIGGAVEQSAKADASIQKLQPLMIALMLIFIMLQMRSFTGTFIVLATAPLGVIGATLALLLFNQAFGFVALLGLIGLAGILMRNTLILTQQVTDNLEEGMDAVEAVVEAAVRRARPVMLTAVAAMLAFIPLTMDSFWGPLAYVLIGGVAVGTVITLLFVPALYALFFKLKTT
ncbi:MAG: AcrB/AcrD/AcrF family protein [Gammaproteobacteria bacterium]|nr:MAG: AcrB/AcrD/AcrF family protein [Gammaproteobacteria bacterium]RLA24690.1 MAG: AcrB/AcrD/AcrF family protein [Gammaproteobacteria bacterium]